MDSSTWIPAAAALVGTVVGGGISELGQWRRWRIADDAAQAARAEDRRAALWQISQPAAARIREVFAAIVSVAEPPNSYEPEEKSGIPFDEGFPEWWEAQEKKLKYDVALIPSLDFRAALTPLRKAIRYGWTLSTTGGYPLEYREAVLSVAQIGFDVISAWMRGEQVIAPDLRGRVDAIAAAVSRVEEDFRSQGDGDGLDD